jgi:hypothetical protein
MFLWLRGGDLEVSRMVGLGFNVVGNRCRFIRVRGIGYLKVPSSVEINLNFLSDRFFGSCGRRRSISACLFLDSPCLVVIIIGEVIVMQAVTAAWRVWNHIGGGLAFALVGNFGLISCFTSIFTCLCFFLFRRSGGFALAWGGAAGEAAIKKGFVKAARVEVVIAGWVVRTSICTTAGARIAGLVTCHCI